MIASSIHGELRECSPKTSVDLTPNTVQILSLHVCGEHYMFLVIVYMSWLGVLVRDKSVRRAGQRAAEARVQVIRHTITTLARLKAHLPATALEAMVCPFAQEFTSFIATRSSFFQTHLGIPPQ
jgi:hypothetical protein